MNKLTAAISTLALTGVLAGPSTLLANETGKTQISVKKAPNTVKPTDNWQGVLFRIMGGINKDVRALTAKYVQDLKKISYANLYQLNQINSVAVVKDRVIRVRQLVNIHDKLVRDMSVLPARFDREMAASGLVEKHRIKVSRGVHKGFKAGFRRLKLENRVIHKLAELYEYLTKHQAGLEFGKQGMGFREDKNNDAYNRIITDYNKLAIAYQKATKTGIVSGQEPQQESAPQKPKQKPDANAKAKDPVCHQYASTAVKQNKFNVNVQCGYTGARWGSDHKGHYKWCLANKAAGVHTSEQRARKSSLERCIKQKLHLTGK